MGQSCEQALDGKNLTDLNLLLWLLLGQGAGDWEQLAGGKGSLCTPAQGVGELSTSCCCICGSLLAPFLVRAPEQYRLHWHKLLKKLWKQKHF